MVIFGIWYTTVYFYIFWINYSKLSIRRSLCVTWQIFVCYMVSLFCYMFDHCVLHGKSWQVTWKIIKCYIVEYCVLHSRALCVTWQSIVCYMVDLFCYMVDHCVLHGRPLFVICQSIVFHIIEPCLLQQVDHLLYKVKYGVLHGRPLYAIVRCVLHCCMVDDGVLLGRFVCVNGNYRCVVHSKLWCVLQGRLLWITIQISLCYMVGHRVIFRKSLCVTL